MVDLSARRSALAARASAEAETLSALAGSLLRGEQALDALLSRVQETFGMRSVSLLERGHGLVLAPARRRRARTRRCNPPTATAIAEIDENQALVLRGRPLSGDDQRILSAFAAQVAVAYRQRELAEAASAVEPLAESERARTALLNAVSHDLRTPIAAAKAAVSSLLADDVTWSDDDRRELLVNADTSLDRLTDLVTNLLDLSRLQAGVLPVLLAPVSLEDVVLRAVDHAAPSDAPLDVDVPTDLPVVSADAGLLERVIANLVQNALRYAPAGQPGRDQRQRARRPGRAARRRPRPGHPRRSTPTRSSPRSSAVTTRRATAPGSASASRSRAGSSRPWVVKCSPTRLPAAAPLCVGAAEA